MFIKNICVSVIFLLLTSCAIKTNVGPYLKGKVHKEITSATVEVYSRNEIWQLKATNLGHIETDFCQSDKRGVLPAQSELNKVLRAKTLDLGGNGIVYDSCNSGRLYMGCELYIRCQAVAYIIHKK